MKLKKLYRHDNGKQIWRILPTTNKKLAIEERELKTKEVYFSCVDIESGKKVFNELQLEEKHWIGIESICNDIIYFHTYGKPDMPAHKSIIAFDILSKSILWRNDNYVFAFIYEEKVYCYQQRFENRIFFALDYLTGNIVDDFGNDVSVLNQLKEKVDEEFWQQNYLFPENFIRTNIPVEEYQKYLQQILTNNIVKGELNYLKINNLLLFNFYLKFLLIEFYFL